MVYSLSRLRRQPQKEDDLKNDDDLKNKDNLTTEDIFRFATFLEMIKISNNIKYQKNQYLVSDIQCQTVNIIPFEIGGMFGLRIRAI